MRKRKRGEIMIAGGMDEVGLKVVDALGDDGGINGCMRTDGNSYDGARVVGSRYADERDLITVTKEQVVFLPVVL